MNFLLDNDVPEELSYLLEHLGHRVSRVREARAAERAALLRLVERAGAEGLANGIRDPWADFQAAAGRDRRVH